MKKRIVSLAIVFTVFMATLIGVSFLSFTGKGTVVLTLAVAATAVMASMTGVWLSYVSRLVVRSSDALNKKEQRISPWSFGNIDTLEQDQEAIKKKFALSAQYIARLGQPESLDTIDEVLRNDTIGEALLRIKSDMSRLREEENKRNWITQGLAMFSEILRNKAEIDEYAYEIISNLARYVNANQAAMFIEYEDDNGRYLEMVSCYAYDKRKYQDQKIREGQGLLGQVMYEREFIFLKDIPANYTRITSGLGAATPRNLVVVPLMLNEKFYGAIELALFQVLEPHQVEFLKKVSENIASEISSIKTFRHTQKLLDESKTLTHELQQREEEMQQNIEEMAAIQEQMNRKQTELDSYLSAINNTIASAEFDLLGNFASANDIFLKVTGYTMSDLAGQQYNKIMKDDASVRMMWDNLREGKFFSGEFRLRDKEGKELWLSGTFNPIVTGNGRPDKIMMFAQFTTQEKEKINDMGVMVNALKSTLPVVEFNSAFKCKTANDKFMKLFGVTRMNLKTRTLYDFLAPQAVAMFDHIKDELLGKDFSSILLPMMHEGQPMTFEVSVTVAQNSDGTIARLIMILVKEVPEKVPVMVAD
ncbi:PAS domain S-box protein [Dawidia soli]|uniref:PAS domain S-box protein n=1 Tax=Dawidia soli TaxID=2782352 RepID=A0AAP2DDX9_9BACT|nr:PAS domain S-box protein [Dawidia soli]MBT1689537.1 PAS domain S-box protein [Dawidia soli]